MVRKTLTPRPVADSCRDVRDKRTVNEMTENSVQPDRRPLKQACHKLFIEPWPPYIGGIALVLFCLLLMYNGLFWGIFGGLRLWGDHINSWLGLAPLLDLPQQLESPLLHRTSLMNILLLLGAFSAALISRQFRFNRPPPLEYVWGAIGGLLMGLGASLAGGCTVGGFFSPLLFSSPAGWTMWIGLMAGAALGLKLLSWSLERITWGMRGPSTPPASPGKRWWPLIGIALVVALFYWSWSWALSSDQRLASRALLLLLLFAIGFTLHRSRLCFVRVFREPFMTAEAEMPKTMILMLLLGIPIGAMLLQRQMVDPYLAIPASFWAGSLIGGFIFGIGMVLAGGCASGTLWRAAEGHIKMVVTLLFFAWSGSIFSALLRQFGLTAGDYDIDFLDGIPEITALGYQAYLPDLLGGWIGGLLLSLVILLLWYLFVRYNQRTGRFTIV